MKLSRHYLSLIGVLFLGAILRFWNLDLKPVWLDEVITALFSLGRNYYDVPLNEAFSLSALEKVFTLNPQTSCAQIAQTVSSQSVHPPLFFCWMHDWMRWVNALPASWIWKLRALPAFIGVVAIAALYQFNRLAFSSRAGLTGAIVMAVSPFAVYLSQEARHYTLPMLLVILALLGLYQIQTDLYRQQLRPDVWFGWVITNSLGFYVHYFFLLAFFAQVATLVVNILTFTSLPTLHPTPYTLHPRRALIAVALATTGICLTYLPWLPTFLSHISRPETDWMKPSNPDWIDQIAPLYQFPMGWILMTIALPVENQPQPVAIAMVLLMLLFTVWLLWRLSGRFGQLWSTPETHLATRMLTVFTLWVLLEFLVIIFGLGKDITSVPRYNFLYFPAVCALVGACLAQSRGKTTGEWRSQTLGSVTWAVLLVGLLSSVLVVSNQAFLKPYQPDQVARDVRPVADRSLLMGMAYGNWQEVALGLSFGLALHDQTRESVGISARHDFAFVPQFPLDTLLMPKASDRPAAQLSYENVWRNLSILKPPLTAPLDFWMVSPGLMRDGYPASLKLLASTKTTINCQIDKAGYHRRGVPYQRYRCP